MNKINWRDNAHLVANGIFQVRMLEGHEFDVYGFMIYTKETWLLNCDGEEVGNKNHCTLLARNIDSITKEEVDEYYNRYRINYLNEYLKLTEKTPRLEELFEIVKGSLDNANFMQINYLLSIGIWVGSKDNVEFIGN